MQEREHLHLKDLLSPV